MHIKIINDTKLTLCQHCIYREIDTCFYLPYNYLLITLGKEYGTLHTSVTDISMFHYLIAVTIALALSLGLTPLMMAVSRRFKILDYPDNRKMHTKPIPLMGGVAIYLSAIIAAVVYIVLFVEGLDTKLVVAFIIGISGVTLMGLIDDILALSAKRRLFTLFVLAIIVLVGCLQFYFPPEIIYGDILITLLISFIVVFWIVGITNAINFSDGLDGLASCLSLVSAVGYAVIFHLQGRDQLALPMTLALGGAIVGFLVYNISPARIFMGDAGSMFIGFMLGILSIMSISQEDLIVFIVPIYLILLPIVDMSMAVLRRLLLGVSVMEPDKMHFHHRLNKWFKSQRLVVLVLTMAQMPLLQWESSFIY